MTDKMSILGCFEIDYLAIDYTVVSVTYLGARVSLKLHNGALSALHQTELTRLLDLYEQIYVQVRLMLPHIADQQQKIMVSHVPEGLDLHLKILEQSRFTTTIHLTYFFEHSTYRAKYEPDLVVRVYHDAQSAEAMSGLIHGIRHEKRETRSLASSWKLNVFLLRWLRYCYRQGHQFSPLLSPKSD